MAVAERMFISDHDFEVVTIVAGSAAVVAVATWVLAALKALTVTPPIPTSTAGRDVVAVVFMKPSELKSRNTVPVTVPAAAPAGTDPVTTRASVVASRAIAPTALLGRRHPRRAATPVPRFTLTSRSSTRPRLCGHFGHCRRRSRPCEVRKRRN